MAEITLTKHAIAAASRRQITEKTIWEAINGPDHIFPDPKDAELQWYVKKIDGRCLVIIVKEETGQFKCITVFYDRRLQRRGLCT